MVNTKLSFEVDASQINIKPILQKEFLELSMKAISSANPNHNNSWFTRESMENSIGTFRNKPILGYFENGDFVSHNGNWDYDSETQMDYWDTLGKQGERILGTIRESDEVKIIEDKNGLSWIVFTCILWTQYSFKQVKRLIKDAKRAAKSGGPTKNISVEVDITDYEILPNGVMKINAFNLVGVTILGSRNGVKVEPGIEDAELSLIDIMGRDIYEKQQSSLRLAYERLNKNDKKGGEQSMENPELVNNANFEEEVTQEEEVVECKNEAETQPEVECGPEKLEECPDCGEETPAEEAPVEEQECRGNNDYTETECKLSEDEDDDEEEHEDECKLEKQEEAPVEGCETEEQECRGTNEETDPDNTEVNEGEEAVLDMGEPQEPIVEEPVVEELSVEELAKQAVLAKYPDICSLASNYEALLQEKEEYCNKIQELEEKVKSFEKKEFCNQAKALIKSANLKQEETAAFESKCESGEIKDLEELKQKIGVVIFEASVNESDCSYTAPVTNPDVTTLFDQEKKEKKKDSWSTLHEYIGK